MYIWTIMRQIFVVYLLLSGLSAFTQPFYESAGWQQHGELTYTAFGWSMSNAGDVNGDGYEDMIVSAIDYSFPEATNGEEGKLYLFYGGADGLETEPAWSFESNNDSSVLGFSTSGGDLNGDGFSDVVAGCLQWTGDEYNEGRIYLWYGSASGLNPGEPDWSLDFDQVFALLGSGVALDGDINNDGYNDLFLSAKMWDEPEIEEGKTWLYWGSPDGPVESGWSWQANQEGAISGFPVNYAGDVNGDGFDDVVIGANQYDFDKIDDGLAVSFYGSAEGLNETPDWMVSSGQKKCNFGHWVDGAGDVNGDGYDDVVVAALLYESDSLEKNEGRIFVYHGSPTGLQTEVAWFGEINQLDAQFGYSCAGAGDINNDGYDDVIGGSKYWDNGEANEGGAFVWFGSSDGLELNYCFSAEGNQSEGYFGRHVGGDADFNNDGYSDFMVGAYRYTETLEADGKAFAYYGAPRPADFYFEEDTFCIEAINPIPTISGISGGVFSGDVVFSNISTGEINLLATGNGGPLNVNYTVDGYCTVTKQIWIQNANAISIFNYATDTFCQNTGEIFPEIMPFSDGDFFSDDLIVDATTGSINTIVTTAGWHTIYYLGTTATGCNFADTALLFIQTNPIITLPKDTFCISLIATTCSVDISGGLFTSPDAIINPTTGVINLSATGVGGPYHINYTIADFCAANEIVFYIDEPNIELANFSFLDDSICIIDDFPTPIITGTSGGVFSSATGTINPISGEIDLLLSGSGAHIIQYFVISNSGCELLFNDTIYIFDVPEASFSYMSSLYLIGEPNPTPNFLSDPGIISSTPGGLIFTDANGTIDLINSDTGLYTITNYVENGSCDAIFSEIIYIQPTCVEPELFYLSNVDGNSATFIWSSLNYDAIYTIAIVFGGDTTTFITTDTTYTFNDLTPQTNYDVFLTINCTNLSAASTDNINFVTTLINNALAPINNLEIYPNPANNLINIKSTLLNNKCTITLYASDGSIISKIEIEQYYNIYTLSIAHLPNGVYYIELNNNKVAIGKTIIKE